MTPSTPSRIALIWFIDGLMAGTLLTVLWLHFTGSLS